MQAELASRAAALAGNTTALVARVRGVWAVLESAREQDKTGMLANVSAEVDAARGALRAQVGATAAALLAQAGADIREKEGALQAETQAQKEQLAALARETGRDRSAEHATISRDAGELKELWARLGSDATFTSNNYTWLDMATARMRAALERERASEEREKEADVAAWRAAKAAGRAGLQANASGALAEMQGDVIAEGRAALEAVAQSVASRFTAAMAGHADAADKLEALQAADRDVLAENARAVASFNASSEEWVKQTEDNLRALQRELSSASASQTTERDKGRWARAVLQQKVQTLLRGAAALQGLQQTALAAKAEAAAQLGRFQHAYAPAAERIARTAAFLSEWQATPPPPLPPVLTGHALSLLPY